MISSYVRILWYHLCPVLRRLLPLSNFEYDIYSTRTFSRQFVTYTPERESERVGRRWRMKQVVLRTHFPILWCRGYTGCIWLKNSVLQMRKLEAWIRDDDNPGRFDRAKMSRSETGSCTLVGPPKICEPVSRSQLIEEHIHFSSKIAHVGELGSSPE